RLTSERSLVRTQSRPQAKQPGGSQHQAMTPLVDTSAAYLTLVSAVRPLLREGDLAAVDRDQLDPSVAGGDLELLTLPRGQPDPGGPRLALVPGRGDHPAAVEEQGVAGARQQVHRDVVAGRVQVARIALAHSQDQHVG